MRIGILGDTHGDTMSMRQAVVAIGAADLWLHTGDFCSDALLVAALAGAPVTAVRGNCDMHTGTKPDEFIETSGYRIWLTHGHRHGVKQGISDLLCWARRYEADAVVFGHTHHPHIETVGGILLFNPGSAAEPRRGKNRTCGVLEVLPEKAGLIPQLISIR